MDPTATSADLITDAIGVINDFNLLPIVAAGAVVGLAMYLLRRTRTASR